MNTLNRSEFVIQAVHVMLNTMLVKFKHMHKISTMNKFESVVQIRIYRRERKGDVNCMYPRVKNHNPYR